MTRRGGRGRPKKPWKKANFKAFPNDIKMPFPLKFQVEINPKN